MWRAILLAFIYVVYSANGWGDAADHRAVLASRLALERCTGLIVSADIAAECKKCTNEQGFSAYAASEARKQQLVLERVERGVLSNAADSIPIFRISADVCERVQKDRGEAALFVGDVLSQDVAARDLKNVQLRAHDPLSWYRESALLGNEIAKGNLVDPKPSMQTDPIADLITYLQADEVISNPVALQRYLGQMFVVGTKEFAVPTFDVSVAANLVRNFGVGAYLVTGQNVALANDMFKQLRSDQRIKALTENLQALSEDAVQLPLLFMADFEGGDVSPLSKVEALPELPSPMALAASHNASAACTAGFLAGHYLRSLQVHMNLAPVVDVHFGGDDVVLADRSFGGTNNFVAQMAEAYLRGQQRAGILSVGKHFPGHGRTEEGIHTEGMVRSSLAPPNLELSLSPFRKLVRHDVDAIMTSYFVAPELTKEIVSLDHRMVADLLRSKGNVMVGGRAFVGLEYEGVIMSDDVLVLGLVYEDRNRLNIDYVNRVKTLVRRLFDSGHDMIMLADIQKTHGKSPRKWMTESEFKEVFEDLRHYIFEEEDEIKRVDRIKQLRGSIIRILKMKKKAQEAKSVAGLPRQGVELRKELWERAFVYRPAPGGGVDLSKLVAGDSVVLIFPTEFPQYKKRSLDDIEKQLQEDKGWHVPREIAKALQHREIHVILEPDVEYPENASATPDQRFRDVRQIVLDNSPKAMIYVFDTRGQWDRLLYILNRMDKEEVYPLKNIIIVPNDRPTVMNRHGNEGVGKGTFLENVNVFVPFSGYKERAKRAADYLVNRSHAEAASGEETPTLPVQIEYIQDPVDTEVAEASDCLWPTR